MSAIPTAHVIALTELQDDPGVAPVLPEPFNPLLRVRTTLQVRVGGIELTVGELLAATEHQVFTLDRLVDEPVDLLVEGHVVARGQLMAVGAHFAVKLTDLPRPLKP